MQIINDMSRMETEQSFVEADCVVDCSLDVLILFSGCHVFHKSPLDFSSTSNGTSDWYPRHEFVLHGTVLLHIAEVCVSQK